jgi:hypothetical protein
LGCARARMYFVQRAAVFKGKRCEEQYLITYAKKLRRYNAAMLVHKSHHISLPPLRQLRTHATAVTQTIHWDLWCVCARCEGSAIAQGGGGPIARPCYASIR